MMNAQLSNLTKKKTEAKINRYNMSLYPIQGYKITDKGQSCTPYIELLLRRHSNLSLVEFNPGILQLIRTK